MEVNTDKLRESIARAIVDGGVGTLATSIADAVRLHVEDMLSESTEQQEADVLERIAEASETAVEEAREEWENEEEQRFEEKLSDEREEWKHKVERAVEGALYDL